MPKLKPGPARPNEPRVDEVVYRVIAAGDQWRLEQDGQSVDYATKEAAFEAAVFAAEEALRQSCMVHICVYPAPNVLNGDKQSR